MKGKSLRASHRKNIFQRKALPLAIGSMVLSFAGAAWGQATSGIIYGMVRRLPAKPSRSPSARVSTAPLR
jgi:hypothetical protein